MTSPLLKDFCHPRGLGLLCFLQVPKKSVLVGFISSTGKKLGFAIYRLQVRVSPPAELFPWYGPLTGLSLQIAIMASERTVKIMEVSISG